MLIISQIAKSDLTDNFVFQFFSECIENYLELPHLIDDYFLVLGSFKKFEHEVIKKTFYKLSKKKIWVDNSKIIEQYHALIESTKSLNQQLAILLGQKIRKMKNNILNQIKDSKSFNKNYELELLQKEDEIKQKFLHLNHKSIKQGIFEGGETDLIPALVVYETNECQLDVAAKTMHIIKKIIMEINPEKQSEIEKFYNNLIEKYEYASKNFEKKSLFLKQIKKNYLKLIKDYVKPTIKQIKKKANENKDFKQISAKLLSSLELISKHQYQGKQFPMFPGKIKKEDLQTTPPTRLDKNQYIIPVLGSGWNKNNGLLYHYILFCEEKGIVESFLNKIKKNKEQELYAKIANNLDLIYIQVKSFFKRYKIDIEKYNTQIMDIIYSLMNSSESRKKFYAKVNKELMKDKKTRNFQFKILPNRDDELSITNEINVQKNDFRIIFCFNSDYKEKSSEFFDRNLLPEISSSLLSNSGIWVNSCNIYTNSKKFFISKDKKWNRGRGFYRIVKAILDSLILSFLFDEKFDINSKRNPFFNLDEKSSIIFIPVIDRYPKNQNKKTNLHQFFYEIRESLMIINKLKKSPQFVGKSREKNLKSLKKTLENRISSLVNINSSRNQFIVQMCEKLPSISNLVDSLEKWKLLSIKEQELLYSGFNTHFKYNISSECLYQVKDGDNKIIRNIEAFLFDHPENKKIILKIQMIDRILRFGKKIRQKTSGKLDNFSDYFLDILRNKLKMFEGALISYFENTSVVSTLSRTPGLLTKTDQGFGILYGMSNSISRNFGSGVNLELKNNTLNLNQSFIIISIEGTSLSNEYKDNIKNRIERISVFKYSLNGEVSYIFDEYFHEDSSKDTDYCLQLENTIIHACRKSGYPVIIHAKSRSKSHIWLNEMDKENEDKNNFTLNNKNWENLFSINKSSSMNNIWGFIRNYVSIPYIKLKRRRNDVYLIELNYKTLIYLDPKEVPQEIDTCLYLLLKGTKKSVKKNKRVNYDFYAHASALITFGKDKTISNKDREDTLRLLLIGAALGDEKGDLGLNGLNRLFVYPYTDIKRRIYSPALFLCNLDHLDLEVKMSEY